MRSRLWQRGGGRDSSNDGHDDMMTYERLTALDRFFVDIENLPRKFVPFTGSSRKNASILERVRQRHMFFKRDFSLHSVNSL